MVENTVNEFAYAQMLLYFKEDFDKLQEKADEQLYFEQDGATPHTSESNKNLIKNYLEIILFKMPQIPQIWLIQ